MTPPNPVSPDRWAHTVRSLQRGFLNGTYVRSLNFHNTPRYRAEEYESQLAFCARHFSGVDEADLEGFFETGHWPKPKPGLILNFFEGYRNNLDIAAPLAEKYGFTGWFFLPSQFMSTPVDEQRSFAAANRIGLVEDDYGDARVAMTWDEVRALDRKHVIACHTQTHRRLTEDLPDDELKREICASKQELEEQLSHEVTTFAWLFGSEVGVNPRADRFLRDAGYRYLLSNFKIQKLR